MTDRDRGTGRVTAAFSTLHKPRWRGSLQARLILSHMGVILLALALVLVISALFLRRYERAAEEERLAQLAVPLLAEVNVLSGFGRSDTGGRGRVLRVDALDAQADALDVRILVFDLDGTVRYDTAEEEGLRRQTLAQFAGPITRVHERAQRDGAIRHELLQPEGGEGFAGDRLLIAAGETGNFRSRRALGIVSETRRYPLLGRFLPRLLLIAALSLAIASAAGFLLSRRIAEPVRRLTGAADAMAAGHLEQEVPGVGSDELGRLVGSFNTMSRRVAATARAQRDLLANVAHELRTPLTSVQGYAQALRDGVIENEAAEARALATIGREADRMTALIGQLLDLARLESGQATLAVRPVSARALLDRVAERYRPQAHAGGVVLSATAPEALAIQGDDGRLDQIVSNLVANAIRHTPPGGLVALAAEPAAALDDFGRPGVLLSVHDTGEGIPADRLPRIFDRFNQGGNGGNDGFGLGLAIVRELVHLHGGTIRVRSHPGAGTTVSVHLPAADLAS